MEMHQDGRPSCCVSPVVVALWERLFEDEQSKDVELVAGNGRAVRCHALILSNSSRVFKQMLSTPMKEGRERRIELECSTPGQLLFLLRFLYTGQIEPEDWLSECEEMDKKRHQSNAPLLWLLWACSFAKKYQVDDMLEMMIDLIKERLDADCFELVLQFAICNDIGPIRVHCVIYAKSEDDEMVKKQIFGKGYIRRKFDDGQLAPEVCFELLSIWPSKFQDVKKRLFLGTCQGVVKVDDRI